MWLFNLTFCYKLISWFTLRGEESHEFLFLLNWIKKTSVPPVKELNSFSTFEAFLFLSSSENLYP